MKKHKIIKSGGRCAADLFHHFVRHHFAILVLGSLGCGCPALGNPIVCAAPHVGNRAIHTARKLVVT